MWDGCDPLAIMVLRRYMTQKRTSGEAVAGYAEHPSAYVR